MSKVLVPSDDLNQYLFGIYQYYTEKGFPQNIASGVVRGVIVCFQSVQAAQLILDYNRKAFFRVSYNGVNWSSWKEL